MLEIKDAPPLESLERKTVWIGDPAIDVKRSDVARWAETGDVEALVPLEGKAPTLITWRLLEEDDRDSLPAVAIHGVPEHLRAAVRIGLIDIEGYDLNRSILDRTGKMVVPAPRLRALARMRATVPYGRTYDRWQTAELGRDSDDDTLALVGEISLVRWLGALILAESFRHGG